MTADALRDSLILRFSSLWVTDSCVWILSTVDVGVEETGVVVGLVVVADLDVKDDRPAPVPAAAAAGRAARPHVLSVIGRLFGMAPVAELH